MPKGKSVLGNIPTSPNKFGLMDIKSDPTIVPPPPTVNDFVNALFQLTEKQVRGTQCRSKSLDPRLAAKAGTTTDNNMPQQIVNTSTVGEPSTTKDALFSEIQIYEKENIMEEAQPLSKPTDGGTSKVNEEPCTPKGKGNDPVNTGAQDVVASARQGRSSKKRGESNRRKS